MTLRLANNPVPVLFEARSGGGSVVSFGGRSGAGNTKPASRSWDVVDCRQHVEAGGLSAARVSPQRAQPDWVDAHMAEPGAKRGLKTSYAPGSVSIGANGFTHAGGQEPTLMESLSQRDATSQLDRRKGPPSVMSSEPPIGMPTTPLSNCPARKPLFLHTAQSASRPEGFRRVAEPRVIHSNGVHNKLYHQALKKRAKPHTVVEPDFTRGLRGLKPHKDTKPAWGSGMKQEAWEWQNPAKLVPAQRVKNTNVRVPSSDEKVWDRLSKKGVHRPPPEPEKNQRRSYQKCYELVGSTLGSKEARREKQEKTCKQASASPVRAQAEAKRSMHKEAAWKRLYMESTKHVNQRSLEITEQKPPPKFVHKPIRRTGAKPLAGYNNSLYIKEKSWDSNDERPPQDPADDPLYGVIGGDHGVGGGVKQADEHVWQHFAPKKSAYATDEPFQTMPMEPLQDEEDHVVRLLPNDDGVPLSRQVSEEVIIVQPEIPQGAGVEMHLLDETNIHASARKHYAQNSVLEKEETGEQSPQEQNLDYLIEEGDDGEDAAFRATVSVARNAAGEPAADPWSNPAVKSVTGKTKEEIESDRFYRAEIERMAREEEDRLRAERDSRAIAVRERIELFEQKQPDLRDADAISEPPAESPKAEPEPALAAPAFSGRRASYEPPAPQKMQPLGSKSSTIQRAAALRRQAPTFSPVNQPADDSGSEEDIAA